MTVTEAIDQIVKYTDNLPTGDADMARRRARALVSLIEVCKRARERDFAFTLSSDVVNMPADSQSVDVPDNCLSLTAPGCGLFLIETGNELEYIDPVEMAELQQLPGFSTDNPEVFSIFGAVGSLDVQQIQFPTSNSGYSLTAYFKLDMPALSEGLNLNIAIPSRWHEIVIIPGVRARMLRARGDASWKEEQAFFEEGMRQMRREEKQGRSGLRQMPSFFGRR